MSTVAPLQETQVGSAVTVRLLDTVMQHMLVSPHASCSLLRVGLLALPSGAGKGALKTQRQVPPGGSAATGLHHDRARAKCERERGITMLWPANKSDHTTLNQMLMTS